MPLKVTNLPDEDHVMRYVPWARLRRDENENVVGILPQAFQLRDGEKYLSVNWVEYHPGDWQAQLRASVWAIRRSFERGIGRKSGFGIGQIAQIKSTSIAHGARVRIVHEPEEGNPAHSAIRRLPRDDLNLLAALADEVFVDFVRNADMAAETPEAGTRPESASQ